MIVSFYRALPWTTGPEGHVRRQTLPHETVGINPMDVTLVEHASMWTDEAGDYWCSYITLRKQAKDAVPLVVVGKAAEIIRRLNEGEKHD